MSVAPHDGFTGNFLELVEAKLQDVQDVVLQEVSRLESSAFQLRSERDGLLRDLAEAKGLLPARANTRVTTKDSARTCSKGMPHVEALKSNDTDKSYGHSRRSLLSQARSDERKQTRQISECAEDKVYRRANKSPTRGASPIRARRTKTGTSSPKKRPTADSFLTSPGHAAFQPEHNDTRSSRKCQSDAGQSISIADAAASAAASCGNGIKPPEANDSEVDPDSRLMTQSSLTQSLLTACRENSRDSPDSPDSPGSHDSPSPERCPPQTGQDCGEKMCFCESHKEALNPDALDDGIELGRSASKEQAILIPAGIVNQVETPSHELEHRDPTASTDSSHSGKRRGTKTKSQTPSDSMNFEILPFWLNKMLEQPFDLTHSKLMKMKRLSKNGSHTSFESAILKQEAEGEEKQFQVVVSVESLGSASASHFRFLRCMMTYCMLLPTSPVCVTWELVSIFMIAYDFVVLPLQIFSPEDSSFMTVMEWVQRLFWTVSIPFTFCVGYVSRDGKVELRPPQVARHYATRWMPFDLTVVVSDWAEVILKSLEFLGAMRLVKTLRISRLLRMMRIVRTIKLPKVMEDLDTRIFSEKTIILLGIAKISLQFACLGHLLACSWYGIGRYGAQDDVGWVHHYDYLGENFLYRYTTSLHWALTQFIGSMDIQPQNVAERLFANVILLCSFVISAWFVSSITARLTRLQIIAGGRDGQFAVLRRYLGHHKISTKLAMRVVRSAQQALDDQLRNASEKDVELLSCVSEPLRAEIHYEMHSGTLSIHAFFKHCDALNRQVVRELCHTAIDLISMQNDDVLFVAGDIPTNLHMFFVVSGLLGYACEDKTMPVSARMWACEAVLWVDWVHLGNLRAHHAVTILALDADISRQVLTKGPREAFVAANYGKRFVEYLNENWDAVLDINMHMENERWILEAVAQANPNQGERGRRPSLDRFGLGLGSNATPGERGRRPSLDRFGLVSNPSAERKRRPSDPNVAEGRRRPSITSIFGTNMSSIAPAAS